MRNFVLILVVALALGVSVFSVAHAMPYKRFDATTKTCRNFTMENDRQGKQVFLNLCKGCHSRGNQVEAPFIHTESKMPMAWNRVFYEKYPKCAQNGAWQTMSLEDQLNLNDFLFRSGAFTYDPNNAESCG